MDDRSLVRLLHAVREGSIAPDDAIHELRRLPWADLGFARIDHHRALRQGMAEVVYGPGKTVDHVVAIVGELLSVGSGPVVVTRANVVQASAALGAHAGGVAHGSTVVWRPAAPRSEVVVLVCAGTADLPVADECAAVLQAHGIEPVRLIDVGVAGIHRILAHGDLLLEAAAVVVVAGMEGALASVVGGLTPAPIVAVPTSVGYGASLEGVTALLGMLASCASGIVVVGIDNGYGAACAVLRGLK